MTKDQSKRTQLSSKQQLLKTKQKDTSCNKNKNNNNSFTSPLYPYQKQIQERKKQPPPPTPALELSWVVVLLHFYLKHIQKKTIKKPINNNHLAIHQVLLYLTLQQESLLSVNSLSLTSKQLPITSVLIT
jgi:hypothetical protein